MARQTGISIERHQKRKDVEQIVHFVADNLDE